MQCLSGARRCRVKETAPAHTVYGTENPCGRAAPCADTVAPRAVSGGSGTGRYSLRSPSADTADAARPTVAPAVKGWGLLTGWGRGLPSLPLEVHSAAPGQRILPVATPRLTSERLRRATRECLLGVAAVEAALEHAQLSHEEVAGPRTALVFASASAYAAANWTFLTG